MGLPAPMGLQNFHCRSRWVLAVESSSHLYLQLLVRRILLYLFIRHQEFFVFFKTSFEEKLVKNSESFFKGEFRVVFDRVKLFFLGNAISGILEFNHIMNHLL